ncbi:hypothetical protein AVEN_4679-1 [Araneus ventricosus]|uniref:Uncharacterized protein n=1 Tax=Araneus ventricosus TaxID=182803 RepID=A0A4Y2LLI5_ARAVE|nr:hypothetical protein AVEN_4679-1 [Araneus ventricosus]
MFQIKEFFHVKGVNFARLVMTRTKLQVTCSKLRNLCRPTQYLYCRSNFNSALIAKSRRTAVQINIRHRATDLSAHATKKKLKPIRTRDYEHSYPTVSLIKSLLLPQKPLSPPNQPGKN